MAYCNKTKCYLSTISEIVKKAKLVDKDDEIRFLMYDSQGVPFDATEIFVQHQSKDTFLSGRKFTIENKAGLEIAKFKFTPFPGNTSIMISSDTEVNHAFRRLGIAKELMKIKKVVCYNSSIIMILATVGNWNKHQVKLLIDSEWEILDKYPNDHYSYSLYRHIVKY